MDRKSKTKHIQSAECYERKIKLDLSIRSMLSTPSIEIDNFLGKLMNVRRDVETVYERSALIMLNIDLHKQTNFIFHDR